MTQLEIDSLNQKCCNLICSICEKEMNIDNSYSNQYKNVICDACLTDLARKNKTSKSMILGRYVWTDNPLKEAING